MVQPSAARARLVAAVHFGLITRKSCTRVARETKNIVFTHTKNNCLMYSSGHFSKKWSSNVVVRHIASRQKHPETNSNHSRPLSSRGESQPTRYSFRVPEQRSHAGTSSSRTRTSTNGFEFVQNEDVNENEFVQNEDASPLDYLDLQQLKEIT